MEEISPIKERILYFIESQGITKKNFCERSGISYGNIKGSSLKSELGGEQIVKIANAFPEISTDWLINGLGEMLKKDNVSGELLYKDMSYGMHKECADCAEKDRIIKNLNDLIDRLMGKK